MQHRRGPVSRSFRSALRVGAGLIGMQATAACAWQPGLYADAMPPTPTPACDRCVSLLSLNTWRLREPARVPRIVGALDALTRSLVAPDAPVEGARVLPDVIALQELEGEEATEALRAALEPEHSFHTAVCARTLAGTPRSAVGLAVRNGAFSVQRVERMELGALFPDHPRCALAVTLVPRGGDEPFTVVAVHLSSRPGNAPQAERFVEELRGHGLLDGTPIIAAGDFNFSPASAGYRALTRALEDPMRSETRPTHWFGGRIDFTFLGGGVSLDRSLDPALAYRVSAPSDALSYPADCVGRGDRCPVSDHLPVGGVYRITR